MADAPAKAESKGTFGFLTRKIGPAPVWLWAAIGFGAYYWYTHYGPGAQQQATAPAGGQRPQVTVVKGGGWRGLGKRGKTPPPPAPTPQPPAPRTLDRDTHRDRKRPPVPGRGRGAGSGSPPPQPAYAPMTAGSVYGNSTTASIDNSTYLTGDDSQIYEAGGPHAATPAELAGLGGAYVQPS